jgi:uncharacterized protein
MTQRNRETLIHLSLWHVVRAGLAAAGLGLTTLYGLLPLLVTHYAIDRKPGLGPTLQPSHFGFEQVASLLLRTQDGLRIAGWWLPNPTGRATVIMAHGHGSRKAGLLNQAQSFSQLGCHVLLIDLRAHGDSEGHWTSGGRLEAHDLLAAVEFVRRERRLTHPVILYGFSLGAKAALYAAAQSAAVDGVVAIAPGCSLKSWFDRQFKRRTGFPTPPGLYTVFARLARLRSGIAYDRDTLDLTARMTEIGAMPLLVICGEHDWMSTPHDAYALQRAARRCEVVVIPGANHLGALYANPSRYHQAIRQFMTQVVPSVDGPIR